jgi:hypothetical protein
VQFALSHLIRPEVAVGAIAKFSELKRELAERTYDEIIGTFATNGIVDE